MTAGRRLCTVTAVALALIAPPAGAEVSAKSAFLERCGGCHGLDGRSAAVLVPDLRDQVGYFLCTPQGRAYVGRLPNVAFSGVSDQALAGIINYTIFTVGGTSVPAGAKAYSAAEVGRLRRQPLTATDLVAQRAVVAEAVIAACPAAVGLRIYKSRSAAQAPAKETIR